MKVVTNLLLGIILSAPIFAEMDTKNPNCVSDPQCFQKCLKDKSCLKGIQIGVHEAGNEMLLSAAIQKNEKGNTKEAISILKSITDDPVVQHPIDAFVFLASLYINQNDYSSAKQTLLKVKDSNNGDVDIFLGSINMREKNYKEAQRLFITGLQKPHSDVTGKKAEENFELVTKYLASKGDQESKWMIENVNKLPQ